MPSGPRPSAALLALAFASLAGLAIMSQFFRTMVAVIAPELTAEFALSGRGLAAISGVFFVAHASMQLPMGIAMDRFGPRRTLSGMLVFALAGSAVFALAGSGLGLFLGMLLIGLGCSTIVLGSILVLARWLPPERFAMAFGGVTAVSNVGTLLSSAPLAAAAEGLGWRGAMLAAGAVTALFGLVAFLTVRDAPPGHAFLSRRRESLAEMLAGLREVLTTRAIWLVLPVSFVGYATLVTLRGLWIGPYLYEVYGLDTVARGNVLLAMSVAIIVGTFAYAGLDRWLDTRKWIALPAGLASVGLVAAMALAAGVGLAAFVALLVAFSVVGSYFLLGAAHAKSFFADRLTGRALTVVTLVTFVGVGVMQLATGLIVDAAGDGSPGAPYRVAFAFMAGAAAAAILVYAFSRDVRPSEAAARG